MIIIGLAGPAGAGKGEVAKYLVRRYGFIEFAWSDALYREVAAAYDIDEDWLRDRDLKEKPLDSLALRRCDDPQFVQVSRVIMPPPRAVIHLDEVPLSPRQVLQWWGTDYRRAQDANYWVRQAMEHVAAIQGSVAYPEHAPQFFVESGTRFENERQRIVGGDHGDFWGNIWHIHRGADVPVNDHISTKLLPVLPGEREIWNNDTIERLHRGVDLLLKTQAKFVKVEQLERWIAPEQETLANAGMVSP